MSKFIKVNIRLKLNLQRRLKKKKGTKTTIWRKGESFAEKVGLSSAYSLHAFTPVGFNNYGEHQEGKGVWDLLLSSKMNFSGTFLF